MKSKDSEQLQPVDSDPLLTLQGIVSQPENLFYSKDPSTLRPIAKDLLFDGAVMTKCHATTPAKPLGLVDIDCGRLIDDGGACGRMWKAPALQTIRATVRDVLSPLLSPLRSGGRAAWLPFRDALEAVRPGPRRAFRAFQLPGAARQPTRSAPPPASRHV